jgi:hypothetical protein
MAEPSERKVPLVGAVSSTTDAPTARSSRVRDTTPRVARLVERYIFNVRLPPEKLDERLPAEW